MNDPRKVEGQQMGPVVTKDPPRVRRWTKRVGETRSRWPFIVAVALLLFLVLVPLFQLLQTSLREGQPGVLRGFTLDHYRQALASSITYEALGNTFFIAAVSTAMSVCLAILFAWLVERTNMPFRNFAWAMLLLPIAVPGILFVMAWILLLSPRTGLVNVALRDGLQTLGLDLQEGPLNIYSMTGLILLDALRGVTTVFLMVVGAFRTFDPSLEEAAKVGGAKTASTVGRVTLPILIPAIIAASMYSFIGSMEQFESALAVGLQAGIFLLSTVIYFTVQMRMPINYGLGAVYAVLFMVIMVLLVIVYRRIVSQTERYVTVSGKGYRPRRIELGRWRYPAFGFVLFYTLITVILPASVLAWVSVLEQSRVPRLGDSQDATLQHYVSLLTDSGVAQVVWNTVRLMLGTATITMALALIVSWAIVRGSSRGRGFVDALSFLPYAFPGITIAIALIFVFLNPPLNVLGLYGTVSILVVGLTTQYLAFGTRLMNGAIVQIQKELEEAAHVSGAHSMAVMWRVTLPLLLPSFIAGWVWVAAHSIRSFSVPLILSSPANEVLSARIWHAWDDGLFNEAAALGVLLMIVLFPLTLLMRRLLVGTRH